MIGYAYYGVAHGLALRGDFDTAIEKATESLRILRDIKNNFFCVSLMERGFAYMQRSDYALARQDLREGITQATRALCLVEIVMPLFPRMIEASLGPNWIDGKEAELVDLRDAGRYVLRARFFASRFPNIYPHVQRVLGRYYFAKGKHSKARKHFDIAIESAKKLGALYEQARALDDSGRAFPELADRRHEARKILLELGAVMPAAECHDYTGPIVDPNNARDAHSATELIGPSNDHH